MEKEKWIQQIISSTKGKVAAEVSGDFTAKLFLKIGEHKKVAPVISIKWVSVAACAAFLLLVCNISFLYKWKTGKQQSTITNSISENVDYFTSGLSQDYDFFN